MSLVVENFMTIFFLKAKNPFFWLELFFRSVKHTNIFLLRDEGWLLWFYAIAFILRRWFKSSGRNNKDIQFQFLSHYVRKELKICECAYSCRKRQQNIIKRRTRNNFRETTMLSFFCHCLEGSFSFLSSSYDLLPHAQPRNLLVAYEKGLNKIHVTEKKELHFIFNNNEKYIFLKEGGRKGIKFYAKAIYILNYLLNISWDTNVFFYLLLITSYMSDIIIFISFTWGKFCSFAM